jgi:RimJ/RimL family protein N-acetyltransferase
MSGTLPIGAASGGARDAGDAGSAGADEPGEAACARLARRLAHVEARGSRVRLRPHRREDARAAYALLAGEEQILRWLLWEGPASADELEGYYGLWCHDQGDGPDLRLAIEDLASGELVGSLSLRFGGHSGQGDLGYWIGRAHQGRGLGREAVELAARLAFGELGAQSLYAWVFVGNTASRRVLERNGFTLVRTVSGRNQKRGSPIDEWHFVRLATDPRPPNVPSAPRVTVRWEEPDS